MVIWDLAISSEIWRERKLLQLSIGKFSRYRLVHKGIIGPAIYQKECQERLRSALNAIRSRDHSFWVLHFKLQAVSWAATASKMFGQSGRNHSRLHCWAFKFGEWILYFGANDGILGSSTVAIWSTKWYIHQSHCHWYEIGLFWMSWSAKDTVLMCQIKKASVQRCENWEDHPELSLF